MTTYSVLSFPGPAIPPDYQAIIYSGWLKSLRHGNDYFRLINPPQYYAAYHRYVSSILHKPEALVRLAVLTDDKDVVLGFSVVRDTILDYVCVFKNMRRQGIATSLVPADIDTITHLTKTALTIWGSKYGHWQFNPFA